MQLTFTWIERLAEALGVPPSELWAPPVKRTFEVEARIVDDGSLKKFEAHDVIAFSTYSPINLDAGHLAYIVATRAFEPFLCAGDVVVFEPYLYGGPLPEMMTGRLSIARPTPRDGLVLTSFQGLDREGKPAFRRMNGERFEIQQDDLVLFLSGYVPLWLLGSPDEP